MLEFSSWPSISVSSRNFLLDVWVLNGVKGPHLEVHGKFFKPGYSLPKLQVITTGVLIIIPLRLTRASSL